MANVVAITRIEHGQGDKGVKVFDIGETLSESDFGEDGLRSLVLNGSAVETGKGRKFSPEPGAGVADSTTVERDALIAKSVTGAGDNDRPSPGAALAVESGAVVITNENAEEKTDPKRGPSR